MLTEKESRSFFSKQKKNVFLTKSRRQLWKSTYEFQNTLRPVQAYLFLNFHICHRNISPYYFTTFVPSPVLTACKTLSGYTQSLPLILGKHLLLATDPFSSPHSSISSRVKILQASCSCSVQYCWDGLELSPRTEAFARICNISPPDVTACTLIYHSQKQIWSSTLCLQSESKYVREEG